MISIFRLATGLTLLALTCACTSTTCDQPQFYQQSKAGQPLVVPSDLSVPSSDTRLEVPAAGSSKAQPGECLDAPPRFVEVSEELSLSKKEREERDRTDFIRNTMSAWAQSWASRNLEMHNAVYDKKFKSGDGLDKDAFLAARAEVVNATDDNIEIRLTDMTIDSNRKDATVRFTQVFIGTGALDPVVRELELKFRSRRWKIVRETKLPEEPAS